MIRRIAIYARCSTDEQTTKNQIHELKTVASRHGWDVVAVFDDNAIGGSMRKYAGELSVGDVWTERPQNREPHSYRVIAIAPGLARITMRVTAASMTTGKPRTFDFFLFNRVEVPEEPAQRHVSNDAGNG